MCINIIYIIKHKYTVFRFGSHYVHANTTKHEEHLKSETLLVPSSSDKGYLTCMVVGSRLIKHPKEQFLAVEQSFSTSAI
jgi:hypothetical protein